MPFDLFGSGPVENEAVRSLVALLHLASDVVSTAELVAETNAIAVKEDTANTSQGLGSQELHLGVRLVWVHKSCGMDLHSGEVDHTSPDSLGHLDPVARAMLSVGGRQVAEIRAVLHQHRVATEIGTVAASCEDDETMFRIHLAVLFVVHTSDAAVLGLVQSSDASFHDEACTTILFAACLFEGLHQSVRDRHAREALLPAVGAREGVPTKARHKGQIKSKLVGQPLDCGPALVSEHLVQRGGLPVWGSLRGRDRCVFQELVRAVLDAQADLSLGQSPVDSRGGLNGIAAHKGLFI
mmetsp:Transcript_37621/g.87914  ORF Transcript_37621/g.87914 Transcript_37621/m.87914 type:complete len:296 (+) Transcript_37621:521-1408(+)